MRGSRYPVGVAALAATVYVTLHGQAPDAAQVLSAARDALGGEKKLSAVKTFTATGRTRQVRGNNLVPIEFEINCELPDKFVRTDEFPAQDADPTTQGFNGDNLIQLPPPPPGRGGPPAPAGSRAGGAPPPDAGRGGPPQVNPAQLRVSVAKQDFVRLTLGMFATSFPTFPLTFKYAGQGEAPEGKADIVDVTGPGGRRAAGPLGRRAVWRSRFQLIWSDADTLSVTQAPTIRVLDAFTSGGAQLSGGDHFRTIDLASDLDYVLGKHSLRSGILLNGGWYRSSSSSNDLGTYTFDNLQAFLANQPSNYTRRLGDPNIAYRSLQGALYVQDDIRVRKNLTLSPGVRYEAQTHVHDHLDIGPRFGVTWAPFASGVTTLRGSAGIFYDWLPTGTYDQTVRVDGFRQQELNVLDPSFPSPGDLGAVPPVNRYLLGSDYLAPQTARFSAGVEQGLGKVVRVVTTYSYQRASRLSRGLNLNVPVDGLRPDPAFANIIDVVSDAASRQHQLQVDANVNPGALLPAFNGPLISWKRTTLFVNYTLAGLKNNTDGPFSNPATGDLVNEWGPAASDVRSRLNLQFNNQIIRNLLLQFNVNTSTGPAYTLLTGRDNNGDGVFNDRPEGVGRNTLRASGQTTLNAGIAYQFAFGRTAPLPPGIGIFGGGAATQVRTFDQGNARYRLQVFVSAQNLTNEANYVGYSGTLTSPFFGRPTTVSGMRKIDAGINLNF